MNFDPVEIRTLIHVATRKTGTPIHDEDLEQDVAVHAIEAFRRLDDVAYPKALLAKIVFDAVRDHWRRRRLAKDLDGIDERFIAHMPAFESDLDRERRAGVLRRALARLPAKKRVLLDSFYVQELSIPEIARMQGRSISAVKMDLARSRRALEKILRRLGMQ